MTLRLLGLLLALSMLTCIGCARSARAYTNSTMRGGRGLSAVPEGQAMLVAIHGGNDASNPVLFDATGRPVCQVPPATHCSMGLTPGRHRLYVAWTSSVVDVWQLDVAEGRTYYGTLRAPPSGWGGFVNEKLTPASPHWGRLSEYLAWPAVAIDPDLASGLGFELGDASALVRRGEDRWNRYDQRHIEAHTFHPHDGH